MPCGSGNSKATGIARVLKHRELIESRKWSTQKRSWSRQNLNMTTVSLVLLWYYWFKNFNEHRVQTLAALLKSGHDGILESCLWKADFIKSIHVRLSCVARNKSAAFKTRRHFTWHLLSFGTYIAVRSTWSWRRKKRRKSLRHISSAIYLAGCSSPLTLRRFVHYQPDRALLWTASSLRVTCWV